MRIRLLFFFVFFIELAAGYAQSHERFYNLSRRDGLTSGSVTSIVQDEQGLIWIGTKQGINRYDGHDIVHYHTGNSGITSNDISELLVDFFGQLWIGTYGGGLHQMDFSTQKITRFNDERIGGRIGSILLSKDSTLWVLSDRGITSINLFNKSKNTNLSPEISKNVTAIALQKKSLWIGKDNGDLFQLESDGSYISYSLADQWPGLTIQKIHPINDDTLFIATRQYGLLLFDKETRSIIRHSIEALDIRDIMVDKHGAFWVGTDGHGIYKINDDKTTNYVHRSAMVNSLVSNAVQNCFEDRDGNLWFGTAWDGISIIDRRLENLQFIYSDFKGSEESGVLNIFIEDNTLWLGTDGLGLSIDKPGNLKRDFSKLIPSDAYVQFIDKLNDKYWIGTFQSGLFIVENKKNGEVKHITSATGLSHDDVRDVEQISESQFLIATWGGGLNLYDEKTGLIKKIGTRNDQPVDVVVLKRIGDDEILVGTFGQGIFIYRTSDHNIQPILSHIKNVVSIGSSKTGIWLGTWGEGLHFSEPPYSSAKPILSDKLSNNSNIFSILSSSDNDDIWLATSERIIKISDREKIQELPVPPQQFHINAANSDDSGRMYFGGTDGVISFKPEDIDIHISKEVELLEVKILNRSINEDVASLTGHELLELSYDQNLITFRYATPTYPSSREETYEILLDPINPEWISVGRERAMTFADLKPGNYEFKVRNSTSLFEENFRFRILNPWWKTWWAYSIFALIFLGLLYAFRRFSISLERVKNQLMIEKIGREKEFEISNIKQRFFVNVSHEIRTPLTLIIGEIEQMALKAGASKSLSNSINNLRNNGNHLIQLVNELLDFRKLDEGGIKLKVAQGNFVVFCKEIFLSFLNKADANGIDYHFKSELDEILVWYDRDQLEKVFFNLISNAFKNTPSGGSIEFIINQNEGFVEAIVKDTGHGIPPEEIENVFKRFYQNENDPETNRNGFGIGLSIVQDITKLHHGEVSVKSDISSGSSFIVKLRSGSDHFEQQDFIPKFQNSNAITGYTASKNPEPEEDSHNKYEAEIMIVEDNLDIRNFLRNILSSRFEVTEATNGLEAYEMIHEKLPDLIVSDVMMPEMDGITLTRKLKQSSTTSHIPIILLTARTGTLFKKEGFETGADDYITKPFDSAILISRIENMLKSRLMLTNQIRNELATRPSDLNLTTPDERFLKDLVKVIQSNLDNSELNAEVIAAEMGMSHSVVYKKIKALTGYNLVEFIRDYRLQQAADILGKYKFTVAETCYKVGFSDKKYFSQIFKKKFGVSPSEFARNPE